MEQLPSRNTNFTCCILKTCKIFDCAFSFLFKLWQRYSYLYCVSLSNFYLKLNFTLCSAESSDAGIFNLDEGELPMTSTLLTARRSLSPRYTLGCSLRFALGHIPFKFKKIKIKEKQYNFIILCKLCLYKDKSWLNSTILNKNPFVTNK